MHLFVKDIQFEKVKNKVYFFHTFYGVVKEQFVGLIDKLKDINKPVILVLNKIDKVKREDISNNY